MNFIGQFFIVMGKIVFFIGLAIYYMIEAFIHWLLPGKYFKKDIKGNVALVTGGGSGIGRLMCLKLASQGAVVVTWDVSEAGNKETQRQVQATGRQCHAYTVDLCDREAVYAAAAKVKQEVGKVDILINNAGVVTGKSLMDSPDELIQRTFDVNTISHFWTTKSFLGDMLAANKGHVVTIASMAGKMPCPLLVDYCASKFAAVGFHETLQAELKYMGKYGVKTTVVCPMLISTGMFEGADETIPPLEPNWVAEQVVDAIQMDVPALHLPRVMPFVLLLLQLLPRKFLDYIEKTSKLGGFMKNFVGRRKTA